MIPDAADSIAADAAFDAAVESRAADAAAATDVDVRRRLGDLGIVGPAAIHLMATSETDLRTVAAEVLGDEYTDGAWDALLRTWSSSAFAGRNELLRRSRSMPPPSSLVAPAVLGIPPKRDRPAPHPFLLWSQGCQGFHRRDASSGFGRANK